MHAVMRGRKHLRFGSAESKRKRCDGGALWLITGWRRETVFHRPLAVGAIALPAAVCNNGLTSFESAGLLVCCSPATCCVQASARSILGVCTYTLLDVGGGTFCCEVLAIGVA